MLLLAGLARCRLRLLDGLDNVRRRRLTRLLDRRELTGARVAANLLIARHDVSSFWLLPFKRCSQRPRSTSLHKRLAFVINGVPTEVRETGLLPPGREIRSGAPPVRYLTAARRPYQRVYYMGSEKFRHVLNQLVIDITSGHHASSPLHIVGKPGRMATLIQALIPGLDPSSM